MIVFVHQTIKKVLLVLFDIILSDTSNKHVCEMIYITYASLYSIIINLFSYILIPQFLEYLMILKSIQNNISKECLIRRTKGS